MMYDAATQNIILTLFWPFFHTFQTFQDQILGQNFFFAFFRELSHSDAKNEKKIFGDFCPLGVTPAGVIEFFGSKCLKYFFLLSFRELSHSDA